MAIFGNLSDRLTQTLAGLRSKGKLTPADVDGTVREIRRALLEADVALPVVKDFAAHVRERALSGRRVLGERADLGERHAPVHAVADCEAARIRKDP